MSTSRAAPSPPAVSQRIPLWDNARFLCVALVVIDHAVLPLTANNDHAFVVYLFIHGFHIPAFAMISGYFSKASPSSAWRMKKILTDILLPYVIMQTIWTIVQYLADGSASANLTAPHWTLWFLLALGIFRLILPYLVLLRWPLVWSILFSIGVGYLSNVGATFSLARAIGLLPFFLLGWQFRQWKLVEKWGVIERQAWLVRVIAVAIFVAWGCSIAFFIPFWRSLSVHWFLYDDSYTSLGQDDWWAGFVRLGFLGLSAVLSAAFFVLVPRSPTWITDFGQATMYIYLLHSFVLYPLLKSGILKQTPSPDWLLLALVLAGIAISIALASPFVRKVFRPLIEPKPKWLFVDIDENPAGPSRTDPTGSRRD
ncbi:MAG: fucose 4-O-acetylase [Microbacteriaceae bacterium]|nr:fucose 4-O-acetylase [Microbacteriaceae bacterium]